MTPNPLKNQLKPHSPTFLAPEREASLDPSNFSAPQPNSVLKKLRQIEKGLRNYGDRPDWNSEFSGRTGGEWDILHATDLRSRNRLLHHLLRPANTAVGSLAYVVNAANNAVGTIFIDGTRQVEATLIRVGGPSFQELAIAAKATPGSFDDILTGGLAYLTQFSRTLKPRFLPAKIQIHPKALAHIHARHVAPWPEKFPTSLFFPGVDLNGLLKKAAKIPRQRQTGGNYERILKASDLIGIDRHTGTPTAIYSVITSPQEKLITVFPGKP